MVFISVSLNEYLLARGCQCFLVVMHVILYMNDDNSAIIVKSLEDESLLQLVMPIKTY